MKLNLNSWHTRFYKNSYSGLPDSLCPYFWKLLIAILVLPITFVGYLIPIIREEKSIFLNFFCTLVTAGICLISYRLGEEFIEYLTLKDQIIGFIVGLGAIALGFVVVFIVVFGIYYIDEYYENKEYENRYSNKPKKQWLVVEWWKGFTGKYCPRIDWN